MSQVVDHKKRRQGISLSPELLAAAKERGGDNLSAYLRRLIERDISKASNPDALAPTILVDLANRLIGEFDAQKVAAALQGRDQREELQKILRSIIAGAGPATGFVLPALSQKIAEKRAKEAARDGAPHTSESQPTVQR